MTQRPPLSKAETEVARLVWESGRAMVRDIHDQLNQTKPVDLSTVQTYLRRLEQKGYLKSTREGRNLVYRPRVKRNTVIRETVNDLVQRLFGGDSVPLIMHLLEDKNVTPEQLSALRELIDRREEETN